MQTLSKIIKPSNSTLLFLRHSSTLSPPQQPPLPTTAAASTTSSAHYDEQIYEAGQSQNFRRLHNLLTRRITDGCLNTNDTFRFVSKTSVTMLDDLLDCLATLPEGTPRKNACDALVRRLCKIDLMNNALQVLDEMRKRNIELNAYSFVPVMEALMRKCDVEKAVALITVMKEYGVAVHASLYNVVLKEYCMKGDVIHAVDLFEKMGSENGLKGDAFTYNAMVLAACKTGKVEGAISVLRATMDDGVKPLHITYKHVIRALLKAEFYEQAMKFVMLVAGMDKKLDSTTFDFLAIGLINQKRLDEAKMVTDEMSKRGLALGQKLRDFHSGFGFDKTGNIPQGENGD